MKITNVNTDGGGSLTGIHVHAPDMPAVSLKIDDRYPLEYVLATLGDIVRAQNGAALCMVERRMLRELLEFVEANRE